MIPTEVLEKMGGAPCETCQHATVPDGIDRMPCANPACSKAGNFRYAPVIVTADIPAFTFGSDSDAPCDTHVPHRSWMREKWRLGKDVFWTWKETQ